MLEPMKARLLRCRDVPGAVERILRDVVALEGAPFGDLQLHSFVDGTLYLVAQTGFAAPFVRSFGRIHRSAGTVCARALRAKTTVVVEDVETDAELQPFMAELRAARIRAVQSTPLLDASGRVIGVVSTHFEKRHRPTPIESRVLRAYADFAGEHLARLVGRENERTIAEALLAELARRPSSSDAGRILLP